VLALCRMGFMPTFLPNDLCFYFTGESAVQIMWLSRPVGADDDNLDNRVRSHLTLYTSE
jgi:hypothetical protein